ncbi:carbamoyltransferase C-terminal domain-containing protein [Microcoleus sp. F4-D5]|uniref:carbamoyltransferase C-terminal domain-containing protein n=1 Tax=Microcoleus sp. F4-D5 TaxID=2818760 RepID=UPI002FD675AC
MTKEEEQLFGIDKLKVKRSQLPSVPRVDCTARIQTVHKETNPRYYDLICHFETLTGCAILVNSSFNVGELIACQA